VTEKKTPSNKWGLPTRLAGAVLLLQVFGCTIDPATQQMVVVQVLTQIVAFALDNLVVGLR
jgi:hypothetical protein